MKQDRFDEASANYARKLAIEQSIVNAERFYSKAHNIQKVRMAITKDSKKRKLSNVQWDIL
jgi:hypothetical protein